MSTSNTSRTVLPPTLVLAGDTLYASSGSLYALDARTGSLRAKLSGLGRDLAIGDDVLIAAQHTENGAVKATALRDGSLLWRCELGGRPSGPPIAAGGTVYLGVVEGTALAPSLADGALRWRFDCGPIVCASPTVADGIVYIAPAVNAPDVPHALALDAATGALIWRAPLPASATAPLAVAGNLLVASTCTACVALSLADGTLRWSYTLDFGLHVSAPIPHDGAIVLAFTEWRRENVWQAASAA